MIDDLLNRDTVLRLARVVAGTADDPEAAATEDAVEVRRAAHWLVAAIEAERRDAPAELTDAEARSTYLPSSPELSLVQAMAEEYLRTRHAERLEPEAATGPLAGVGVVRERGLLDRVDPFEDADFLRWGVGFFASLLRFRRERHAFRLPAEPPARVRLGDDARVILVGDWGTGERMAREVAARIREELESAGDRPTHVVHLGDVYYAGTETEARERFLRWWPVRPDEANRHRSWCLNANHDMYAAGTGLLNVILADPRFAAQRTTAGERTTQFHLVGDHWQILGLDSAWKLLGSSLDDLRGHVGHFGDEQIDWLLANVGDGRPDAILLSHHQPFTRRRAGLVPAGNLLEQTAPVRATGGVRAWFWGHEHRCRTYGAEHGIAYAALVGHGAVPQAPAERVIEVAGEWELNDAFTADDGERWRRCGFAVVDFWPDAFEVRYIDDRGRLSKTPADRVPRR